MAKRNNPEIESDKINAMPTKELFIKILTRDIELVPAIIDLVDNCGDGARRLTQNYTGKKPFDGLWARLQITSEKFCISDNCGGISVEIAKKYAFRFGRTKDTPAIKHSVGEFGVGMKRAIFKIGNRFKVTSTTKNSRFVVEVDIDEWAKRDEWEYDFTELQEHTKFDKDLIGTNIEIDKLHDDISKSFQLGNFLSELKEELQIKLRDVISKGLSITLNGIPIESEPLILLSDKRIAPAYKELRYPEKGKNPVKVKLFCGLGKSEEPEQAGWHVFCNGRLILEGDKSIVTGWGFEESGGIKIPGFHPQYNHLRGFAYFDSDDPGKLPWNTTKTGLNSDSSVYRAVKIEMIKLMRPVVNFLNKLSQEKKDSKESGQKGQLEEIVSDSKCNEINKVSTRTVFIQPRISLQKVVPGPKMQKINYEIEYQKANSAKKVLKASSWKQMGIETFNYFYDAEVGN